MKIGADEFSNFSHVKGKIANSKNMVSLRICPTVDIRRTIQILITFSL